MGKYKSGGKDISKFQGELTLSALIVIAGLWLFIIILKSKVSILASQVNFSRSDGKREWAWMKMKKTILLS